MERLSIKEIAQAIHADTQDTIGYITSVVTDSREVSQGSLFVVIEGENFDGHLFINDAFERGAVAVVARLKGDYIKPDAVLYVPDTRMAHIEIGAWYKSKFPIPVVAITGSVGKTTTKEFVAGVLASHYNTHKNQGNFNNEIGLPKTLFGLTPDHEIVVLEMGMSSLGEIHNLACAVKPTIGLITNIGVAHIELLGSQENILKAKLELLDGMEKGSPLVLCADDTILAGYSTPDYEIIRYGVMNPTSDVKGVHIQIIQGETVFDIVSPWGEYTARIPTIGTHNVLNALAAFVVGVKMGVSPDKAAAALKNYRPSGMRQNMVEQNGVTYVEDCYNCSPDSLKAAVLTLAGFSAKGKKIMVLSDMLELGDLATASHISAGEFIAKQGIDMLLVTGPLSIGYIEGASKCKMERALHFDTQRELANAITKAARVGDIVWIKGSRGMKLEELVEMLYEVRTDA